MLSGDCFKVVKLSSVLHQDCWVRMKPKRLHGNLTRFPHLPPAFLAHPPFLSSSHLPLQGWGWGVLPLPRHSSAAVRLALQYSQLSYPRPAAASCRFPRRTRLLPGVSSAAHKPLLSSLQLRGLLAAARGRKTRQLVT